MTRLSKHWVFATVLVSLFAWSSTASADDGANTGASLSLSTENGADADANANAGPSLLGGKPTHRQFNVHLAGGFIYALGDDLDDYNRSATYAGTDYGRLGGQALLGVDIVLVEPLSLSIIGGFNGTAAGDKDAALRSAFVGAGFMLRMFAYDKGSAAEGGSGAGSLWLDAHIDYVAHLYQDHGGYDIGLGYEFALWKDVNFGPYLRFQHVPWGDGLHYMLLSAGLQLSFGADTGPKDRDGDGIVDDEDKCPDVPEDKDGFEDGDGCPDADNDNDGILDADDKCPDVAGIPEKQGCPNDDNDADGILNAVDKCPDEAEDKDGFEDEDGCPDPDNDLDGVLDPNDKCPVEKEDADGFEDEDGCPDTDNDKDGILDATDQCPNEAETVNGKEDEDGCPDLVRVVGDQIKILEKVYFATKKDTILDKSFEVLKQVAGVVKAKPLIKIRIEGHTDDVGKDKDNMSLSQRRAESVKKFLVNEGIEADRLTAEGFGETKPLADNKTEEGKAENRRVEFHIVAPAVQAVPALVPTAAPAPAPEAAPAPAPEAAPVAPAPVNQ
jgi:outer membrane protein OmpA-like peptidoglycan-associated protein